MIIRNKSWQAIHPARQILPQKQNQEIDKLAWTPKRFSAMGTWALAEKRLWAKESTLKNVFATVIQCNGREVRRILRWIKTFQEEDEDV